MEPRLELDTDPLRELFSLEAPLFLLEPVFDLPVVFPGTERVTWDF